MESHSKPTVHTRSISLPSLREKVALTTGLAYTEDAFLFAISVIGSTMARWVFDPQS